MTGAGGFIGSHAVLELMEDGYDIVAVDNFFNSVRGDGTELPESLRRLDVGPGFNLQYAPYPCLSPSQGGEVHRQKDVGVLQRGPLRQERHGEVLLQGTEYNFDRMIRPDPNPFSQHKIDCVMHFAAAKAVAESVREPLMYYSNNVNASTTLLQVGQLNPHSPLHSTLHAHIVTRSGHARERVQPDRVLVVRVGVRQPGLPPH